MSSDEREPNGFLDVPLIPPHAQRIETPEERAQRALDATGAIKPWPSREEQEQRKTAIRQRLVSDVLFRRAVDEGVLAMSLLLGVTPVGREADRARWAAALAVDAAERLSHPTTPENRSEAGRSQHSAGNEQPEPRACPRCGTTWSAGVSDFGRWWTWACDHCEKVFASIPRDRTDDFSGADGSPLSERDYWAEAVADPIIGPVLREGVVSEPERCTYRWGDERCPMPANHQGRHIFRPDQMADAIAPERDYEGEDPMDEGRP